MKKTKRNYLAIVLIVLLLALAIGYASFTKVLNVTGNVIGKANWDVVIESITISNATGDLASDTMEDSTEGFSATNNGTSGTFEVTLAYPGDAVKVTVVIKNKGSINAKLTSCDCAYTAGTRLDVNNVAITEGDQVTVTEGVPAGGEVLDAGDSCTAEFVIKWDEGSEAKEVNGTYEITYTYEQNTEGVNLTANHSHT